jgi:mannosyltransferase OCH1-like enzyme
MIPKIIHYCWLSKDPYPEKILHCLDSWNKILIGYKIILWDWNKCEEESIINNWIKEAYSVKKYAFAADYIRLYAVYKYGGIYLDSDVEVIKSFDDLLHLPYFIGKEAVGNRIEVAAFGAEKGCKWIEQCLDYYKDRHFIIDGVLDMKVMPDIIHDIISPISKYKEISSIESFIKEDSTFCIFPRDWFCANIYLPNHDKPTLTITNNTFCIHHFTNTWVKTSLSVRLRLLGRLTKLYFVNFKKIIRGCPTLY